MVFEGYAENRGRRAVALSVAAFLAALLAQLEGLDGDLVRTRIFTVEKTKFTP